MAVEKVIYIDIESYLAGFMSEVSCTLCSLAKLHNYEKSWENPLVNKKTWLAPFYKTINNINIIFSDHFQKRYKFGIFLYLE